VKEPKEARFSPKAIKAFFSRRCITFSQCERAIVTTPGTAGGFFSLIELTYFCNGRVQLRIESMKACSDFVTGSFGSKANMRSSVDFSSVSAEEFGSLPRLLEC